MSGWLNGNGNGNKNINVVNGPETREKSLPPNTPLREAVIQIARDEGFSDVLVKVDGAPVSRDGQGNTPIGQLGNIEIYPKFCGAKK